MSDATPIVLPAAGLKHTGLITLIDACDIQLPSGQKLALIALARCRDSRSGRSVMSFKTIGQRSGCGERQASRHIEALMGLGLVTRVGLVGKCYVYTINLEALAKAGSCKKSPQPVIEPVDNSADTLDIGDTDPGHLEQPPLTFTTSTPDMDVRYSGEFSGVYSGEESEAQEPAAEQAPESLPPLPIPKDPKSEQPTEPAVAIAPDTLAAVNAQRAANGKTALSRADLAEIGREATLAGIAPQAAAEWILARQTRNFFRAAWLARPANPAGAPAPAAPIDEAARAAARAKADAVQAELLRRSITAMRQDGGIVLPPTTSATTRQAAQARTVTVRSAAPVSVGASVGTGWAQRAVARFVAAEPISHATITSAAVALGLSMADLKAQRAAAMEVAA